MVTTRRSNTGISARVAHAYFKYGRFCSSHPTSTILCSILSVLFLSYPLTRLRLPSSAPFDTVLADNVSEFLDSNEDDPSWLQGDAEPVAYIQQIFIRSKVEPWDPGDLTVKDAIKGPMIRAFELHELLTNFITKDNLGLENFCFHVVQSDPNLRTKFLPDRRGCLILSPAQFWHMNRAKFYDDDLIFDTIYGGPPCTNDLCVRDLLFGMPTRLTGVRIQYHTNRQRRVQFAITVVLTKYSRTFINQLRSTIFEQYANSSDEASGIHKKLTEKFVHIYYKGQKAWSGYVPLTLSYCFVFVYLYFSLRKIEMVKSKWGLAFSAVFTVASSLVMASGICIHFDLTPRLWSAELFPYLAMIVGIENMLCITRAVVSTPVTLDFRSRIAHGLSIEGWSITKNFLAELAVVSVGFVTRIPEIQEFCTLAFIGLVVDFYMQLFFYAPCLTFDLERIDSIEKRQLLLAQSAKYHPIDLQVFPPVVCPFAQFFSKIQIRSPSERSNRANSLSSLGNQINPALQNRGTVGDGSDPATVKDHPKRERRSSPSINVPVPLNLDTTPRNPRTMPRRLRFLLFLSKTRFLQRSVALLVVGWICWLAIIVHQWQNISNNLGNVFLKSPEFNNQQTEIDLPVIESKSTPLKETSWIQWDLWQRQAFSWYPILFDSYNVSLSGRFITLLPPIILESNISPEQTKSVRTGIAPAEVKETDKMGKLFNTELSLKISWLELQMFIVLILSCGIFLTVGGFIMYVCFISGNESYISSSSSENDLLMPKKTHRRIGSKVIVESKPIVFRGHDQDVEFLCLANESLVSSCLGGRVIIWNSVTGDLLNQAQRNCSLPAASVQPTIQRNVSFGNASRIGGGDASPQTTTEHQRTIAAATPVQLTSTSTDVSSNTGYDFNRNLPSRRSEGGQNKKCLLDFNHQNRPAIWCLAAWNNLIAVGLADGTVELYKAESGVLLCQYRSSRMDVLGVTHICLRGSRFVVARLNGQLDFIELRMTQTNSQQRSFETSANLTNAGAANNMPDGIFQCRTLVTLTAHQHAINCMKTSTRSIITASDDHTLKVFDLHGCCCICTLYGHNAPVTDLVIDHEANYVYSTCADGLICVWDIDDDGTLVRTLVEVSYSNAPPVALALSSTMLVGQTHDGSIWLWKKSGELITRIKPDTGCDVSPHVDTSSLIVLSDKLAVSAYLNAIRFWDLQYKVMLREIKLEDASSTIRYFIKLDELSVACCKGNFVYRINFPVIKLK